MNNKTIILVRHGESTFNKSKVIQGQTNISSLTKIGVVQAEKVAKWLNDINISKIYSSPLNRAKDTAKIISKDMDVNLEINKNLTEIDFGNWSNQKHEYIKYSYPEIYHVWRQRPYDFLLKGKFPVRELYQRINNFNERYVKRGSFNTIVIVGHKGSISALIISLLKLPKTHHHFLQIDSGSISVLRERDSKNNYELTCANEMPFSKKTNFIDFYTEERTKSKGDLFIVRHGQTISNIERKYQGKKDIEISEIGKKNIRNLSNFFLPRKPSRIISSPLIRATKSALILANEMGFESISIRDDLKEFSYGEWEGKTEKSIKSDQLEEYTQWITEPINFQISKGEHIDDAYIRCKKIWEFYERDINYWGGSIISVVHDIVNRLLICNALNLPPKYLWKFSQTNASLTVVSIKKSLDGKLRILNNSPYDLKKRLKNEWL